MDDAEWIFELDYTISSEVVRIGIESIIKIGICEKKFGNYNSNWIIDKFSHITIYSILI